MSQPRYRDPRVGVEERVADLLGEMTLDEKLAQLACLWSAAFIRDGSFDRQHAAAQMPHGIGQVTRIGAATGLRPRQSAELMNAIQQVALERTRLGIPIFVHEEAVGGFCHRDATVFPQGIGLAATWDPALLGAGRCGDPRADASRRRAAGASPGDRRGPRPSLGPRRGDLRRGSGVNRHAGGGLRTRAPDRRPARRCDRHRQTFPWLCPLRGRPELGPRPDRPARAARGLRRALCRRDSRGRDRRGDELLRLHRRHTVLRQS